MSIFAIKGGSHPMLELKNISFVVHDTDEELVSRFVSCTKFMDRIRGIEEEE